MKFILLLFVFTCLYACAEKERPLIIRGDLYFDTDAIGSFYGWPENRIQQAKKSIDSLYHLADPSDNQEFLSVYESLGKNKVLYLPFVDVYMPGDSVVKLYLDSVDYQRLATFNYHDLIRQNKKVQIEATTRYIRKGYYKCVHLRDVHSMDGETYPRPDAHSIP